MALHSTTVSWRRRGIVLLAAASTTLGLAVVVSPAADAAKPLPPEPTAQLQILQVQDEETFLPDAAPDADAVGYIRPGLPFSVTVQSQTLTGDPLPVGTKTNVTLSGSGYSATATIEKDASEVTITGQLRSATSNFSLTAAGAKNSGYATDTIPVVVGVKSTNQKGLGANETLALGDCVLGVDNPTCVSLSVDGAVTGNVLLSTSECATFPGTDVKCTTKKGKSTLVAQTLVDLAEGQVATAILYCDKSLCGNGGVAQYIPLVDKGNTGAFAPAPLCPAKGVIGDTEGGICVDLRQSTRFNAGDLATYILFNHDARMIH
jgi:hypothetical protein